jgi:glycosyltransferase involved in cell wall biosynthesis
MNDARAADYARPPTGLLPEARVNGPRRKIPPVRDGRTHADGRGTPSRADALLPSLPAEGEPPSNLTASPGRPRSLPGGSPRLLMIVPWLTMGGADKFNLDLVEQLTSRGYEITICTTREGDNSWQPRFARFTSDIFIRDESIGLREYPHLLGDIIESRQIDLVLISNSTLGYQLLPYLRSRCSGTTFVDYCHIYEEYWRDGGHPLSAVTFQEFLDLNIVSNQDLKEWMVRRGGDAQRIEVCYTNVDALRWDPGRYSRSEIRQELSVRESEPLVLYAGRLCEQKRPRVLAKVMLELCRQRLKFVCLVAGDGEERSFLEYFVWRHRLGKHVRLLGEVSNDRVRELMAAADIFFLPSQWEGIALTLFEAMAMELVPVSSDVGGQRELVTPDCGFLIPHGDNQLHEYVSVMRQLIESPDLRQTLGAAARQRILERFTIDEMGDRMVELFGKAQELAKTSPRAVVGEQEGLTSATLAMEQSQAEETAGETRSLTSLRRSRLWHLGRRAVRTAPGWLVYQAALWVAGKLGLRDHGTAAAAR